MKNILIDMGIEPAALEKLRSIPGVSVRVVEPEERVRPLPAELIRDVHIEFCSCPPQNFGDMASIELIQICSSGYSQLFDLGLPAKGIRACNGRGIFDLSIAEWIVAMMVNLVRDLRGMIRHQDAEVWDRSPRFQREIRGLTVGFWGYGGIGREAARLAKAMGLKVCVLSRSGVRPRENVYVVPGTGDPEGKLPDRVFLAGEEEKFLAAVDFLVLGLPLTKTTEGLIGEKVFRALRPSAFVLNPARGPIIREEALLRALREGWIAGAALDAHFRYPLPPEHPLWRLPQVLMTPHIAGVAVGPAYRHRVWDIFLQNVERHLAGSPLLNELSTDQLLGR